MCKNTCKRNIRILVKKLTVSWFGPFSELVAITGRGRVLFDLTELSVHCQSKSV